MIRRKNQLLHSRTFKLLQEGDPVDPYFLDEACFHVYLNRLLHGLKAFRVQLHTYVLMPCLVQLLASPYSRGGFAMIVETTAIDYGEYFINRFGYSCSLQRCKPALQMVPTGGQLLDCQKDIELAPVRAGLVDRPVEYRWSGYRTNAFGGHRNPIVMHREYRDYCFESRQPYQRYRDFVAATASADSFHPRTSGLQERI